MIVYRGGVEYVEEPVCDYNERDDLDFGYGFYTTSEWEEAVNWAEVKSEEHLLPPVVNEYTLDDSYIHDNGYLLFEDPDDSWFDFLEHCRSGEVRYKQSEYPIVEGEVADDSGYEIFEDYHDGKITREYAHEQLMDMDLGKQICFRTDEAIHQYLTYNRTIELGY